MSECKFNDYLLESTGDLGFPGGARGKDPACQCRGCKEHRVRSLGWEDPLEEAMATHFTVFLPGESLGQRNLAGYSP